MAKPPEQREVHPLPERGQSVKELFRQSFRFSQGDPNLQGTIFSWLVVKGYISENDVPIEVPSAIYKVQPPRLHKDSRGGIDERKADIKEMWHQLYERVRETDPDSETSTNYAKDILSGIIYRDLKYQKEERPDRTGRVFPPDSPNDPHASLLRKFAILGESTGVDAYDILHAEIGVHIIRYKSEIDSELVPFQEPLTNDQRVINKLAELADLWERNHNDGVHPQSTFFA